MTRYYAVLRGRKNRTIVKSWEECKALVENFPGAIYKSFNTWKEAAVYLNYNLDSNRSYSEFKPAQQLIEPIYFQTKMSSVDKQNEITLKFGEEIKKCYS